MAPARLIHRRQQDILLGFLEENKELLNGMVGNAHTQENIKQKWTAIARQLNAVDTGLVKSPIDWKKYWFLWRHRCLKKASIARQLQSGPNKLAPFTDQDTRLLKLCGKATSIDIESNSLHQECTEKSDDSMEFQPTETIKVRAFPVTRARQRSFGRFSRARTTQNHDPSTDSEMPPTPPPKWALEIEERRIQAEERMAAALEAIASVMQAQGRQNMLHEQLTDSVASIAGMVQDINRGVQVALQMLHQATSVNINGPDIKQNL